MQVFGVIDIIPSKPACVVAWATVCAYRQYALNGACCQAFVHIPLQCHNTGIIDVRVTPRYCKVAADARLVCKCSSSGVALYAYEHVAARCFVAVTVNMEPHPYPLFGANIYLLL